MGEKLNKGDFASTKRGIHHIVKRVVNVHHSQLIKFTYVSNYL